MSQVQTRSSIIGNSVSAIDTQKVLTSILNALINENYFISANIGRYQSILEHAIIKSRLSIGKGIIYKGIYI